MKANSPTLPAQSSRIRAVTLVELLTVIAVIGILAAILIPVASSMRQTARAANCTSNLRQIGVAVLVFVGDHKGILPGSGQRPGNNGTNSSASWQDVLNVMVFEANLSAPRPTLQRMGESPNAGQMYCPSMERFGTAARYPRAYVINSRVMDHNVVTNPPVTWGVLLNYQKGYPYVRFATPARTVMVLESERSGDGVGPSAPFDQVVMGDGVTEPSWSANSQSFAFRHKGRLNLVFMDGHVQSFAPAEFARLNNSASFSQSGL
jgi:prepilin-type processing-associated H-X9-DG protein/prepilin-type N-terminal cleavage/methylation domain-containing protein